MKASVIQDYQAVYLYPIAFTAGETVQAIRRDTEYPGWIWCAGSSGKSGWVPERYLQIEGERATALRDYNAVELTVEVGEILTLLEIESGWAWVETGDGRCGWVPVHHLQVEPEEPIAPGRPAG